MLGLNRPMRHCIYEILVKTLRSKPTELLNQDDFHFHNHNVMKTLFLIILPLIILPMPLWKKNLNSPVDRVSCTQINLSRYLEILFSVYTQYPAIQLNFEINKPGVLQALFLSQRSQGTQRKNR